MWTMEKTSQTPGEKKKKKKFLFAKEESEKIVYWKGLNFFGKESTKLFTEIWGESYYSDRKKFSNKKAYSGK